MAKETGDAGVISSPENLIDSRPIHWRSGYDVVVVGGGVGGIAAAVAAAREGVSVLLIEKSIVLGGLATIGLISWYEPLCDGNGVKVTGGLAEELLNVATQYGFDDLAPEWRDPTAPATKRRYATNFSPTLFALALDELLERNGVRLRLDTLATFPVMQSGVCQGVVVESVSGREFFPSHVVIDATGDASVLHRAGVPTVLGDNYLSYVAHGVSYKSACDYVNHRSLARFREWISVGSNLSGHGHPEGMPLCRGDSADAVTDFVLTGRRMLLEKLKKDDRSSRDLSMLATMPQYRKIRRLDGATVYTAEELNNRPVDSVGSFADFRKRGRCFQLPYSTLYHPDYPNLLAAGRVISSEGEGWEMTRVIPVAALSGQAAGTAAAMCARSKTPVGDVEIGKLQEKLRRAGVLFA